jgi:hypothetical protein
MFALPVGVLSSNFTQLYREANCSSDIDESLKNTIRNYLSNREDDDDDDCKDGTDKGEGAKYEGVV